MASNPSTKPWGGGMGSWALEAEQAEADEIIEPPSQSFPSLKEAVAVKPKKKNKGTKLSLSEFTTGAHVGPGFGRSGRDPIIEAKGLTPDEILRLPTGPRERTAEEIEQGRHGGGFRNYGSYGGGGGGRRDEGEGRRGYGTGFGEEGARSGYEQVSSRADDADNWGAGKKSFAGDMPRRESRDRYENLGNGGGGGGMRADEVDNWGAGKKQMIPPARGSGFGFHDSSSGSADSDRWARGRDFGGGSAGDFGGVTRINGDRVRTRLVLDPPKKNATTDVVVAVGGGDGAGKTHASVFGAARPREEVLAEKGVDWRKVDIDIETKKTNSRPGSAQSRDSTSSLNTNLAPEMAVKPRPKSNPFGDAKPREILLEERGKDWRKIDIELEHRSIDRIESEHEKMLKELISDHRKTLSILTDTGESTEHSSEEINKLNDEIIAREKELEQLMHDLDDKVKFGQRSVNEFGPGSRSSSFSDNRPPSRSSIPDESRSSNYNERPGSRGSVGDAWSRSSEERRGFRTGNREGGFFGNQSNRPLSRERRW